MNDRKSEPLDRTSGGTLDVLSDVLRAVRLTGAVFFDVNATTPWVAESPASGDVAAGLMPGSQHVIPFHVLTRGACMAGVVGRKPVTLAAGDVVVFPQGDPHVLSSRAGMRAPADMSLYRRSDHPRLPVRVLPGGGGKPEAHLICGFLGCDARPFNPLLDALPQMIVVPIAQSRPGHWLKSFTEVAVSESRSAMSGSDAVLARLSELMFIEAVRQYVQSLPANGRGWLAGLRDPAISQALGRLHAEPARPWTLPMLAQRCGLSRSALAERFHNYVGVPPMQYLARWRMQLAANLLASGSDKVAAVARQVGYEAEAAFSRAFKKLVGMSPAAWRARGGTLPG